jgi:hypothetical protein
VSGQLHASAASSYGTVVRMKRRFRSLKYRQEISNRLNTFITCNTEGSGHWIGISEGWGVLVKELMNLRFPLTR